MPRKVRELKADLKNAGFVEDPRRGKGSHSYWEHPSGAYVVLSGQDGDDAQPYQERDVKKALKAVLSDAKGESAMNDERARPITEEELAEARRYSLVIAWSDEDDSYVVSVPEIPGLHTHGATIAEAAEMGEEAIATWLGGRRRWGHDTPMPPQTARRVVVDRPPQYDAAGVRAIRERARVSQAVFAAALNVSPSTVQSWEGGARRPDGPSLRLLELADRQPAALFRSIRPASRG